MVFARVVFSLLCSCVLLPAGSAPRTQVPGQSSPSSSSASSKQLRKSAAAANSRLDCGAVSNGLYRNPGVGFTCKIPAGWVLRTEEMNAGDENALTDGQLVDPQKDSSTAPQAAEKNAGKVDSCVLLAAFSRPPQALGEDVNSSILIAAENAASYPGLKEAVQYFGPLTEVAKAQGFTVVNEPYEFPVGAKTLVREDFQKNAGSRVMRQSTLVMLAHGYALSFNFIGGTEDEVEDLMNGLSFAPTRTTGK